MQRFDLKRFRIDREVTPEDFMFAGADAFSRQVVKMMIAPNISIS